VICEATAERIGHRNDLGVHIRVSAVFRVGPDYASIRTAFAMAEQLHPQLQMTALCLKRRRHPNKRSERGGSAAHECRPRRKIHAVFGRSLRRGPAPASGQFVIHVIALQIDIHSGIIGGVGVVDARSSPWYCIRLNRNEGRCVDEAVVVHRERNDERRSRRRLWCKSRHPRLSSSIGKGGDVRDHKPLGLSATLNVAAVAALG